jgi:hypothetical protein
MLSESVDPSFTEQAQSPLSSLDLHPCAILSTSIEPVLSRFCNFLSFL